VIFDSATAISTPVEEATNLALLDDDGALAARSLKII
jgi:hypothetical protein